MRMVLDHLQEYPSLTASAAAVARWERVGKKSARPLCGASSDRRRAAPGCDE